MVITSGTCKQRALGRFCWLRAVMPRGRICRICTPSGSVPCRIDFNSVCSVSASNPLLCVPVAPSRCLRTRKTQTQRAKGQPAAEGAGACEGRRPQSFAHSSPALKSMPRCHLRPHPLARLRRVGHLRPHPLARVPRVGGHLGPEACCLDRWPAGSSSSCVTRSGSPVVG